MLHALLLLVSAPAQTTPAAPAPAAASADNAEMTRLFDADQAIRQGDMSKLDAAVVMKQDADRRTATRALLDAGKLTTGTDYWHAAFVFQHGGAPENYLLAHSLAIAAAARGNTEAPWIAAASLDRYLQATGRPQVYGTQFRWQTGQPVTQEPYDRAVVSDALRAAVGVPPLADQEKRRVAIEAERAR